MPPRPGFGGLHSKPRQPFWRSARRASLRRIQRGCFCWASILSIWACDLEGGHSMSRFLHTMLRVGDLQRSIDFYTKGFGMIEIRRNDVPDGKYTLAFVGYGDEDSNTVLELTYNYGTDHYD